jgi:hypothetical protein
MPLFGSRDQELDPEEREFRAIRSWALTELAAADRACLELHLVRFLAKVHPTR